MENREGGRLFPFDFFQSLDNMWSTARVILLVSSMSMLASAGSEPACYQRRNDQIILQPNWYACSNTGGSSGVQLCCEFHSIGKSVSHIAITNILILTGRDGDLCGQDSVCRSPEVQEGNEWYVGGCTDKTYEDEGCSYDCSKSKLSTYLTSDP